MLKRLRIQNFKCWQDTGDIKLAPLTLLFGTNSSGKSSIGQFLMMLKQTADRGDRKAAFYLGAGAKDSMVQLGSFRDIVFHHDIKQEISFEYDWTLPKEEETTDAYSGKEYKWDVMSFAARVAFREKNAIPYVKSLKYGLHKGDEQVMDVVLSKRGNGDYKLDSKAYKLVRNHARVWDVKNTVRFYGFPDEVNTYYQNSQFVQTLNYQQERLFKQIGYLGPMRCRPDRIYSWSGNEPDGIGELGEYTIPAMLAAGERLLNFTSKGKRRPFQAVIADSLKKLGLIDEFRVEPLSNDLRREFAVKVKTRNSKDWVDLPDVGFGISQVLPVLVACYYAPPGSTLLIEEPEIHLHPSAQSSLADVFIDVLNAHEGGRKRDVQLIIETHSEHLLRRLQRRIAEQAIRPKDTVAYFVDVDTFPTTLKQLNVDLFGNVLNWPKGFFGNEMEDVLEQTRIAIKRSKEVNPA